MSFKYIYIYIYIPFFFLEKYIYILIVISIYIANNKISYLDFIILRTKTSLYKLLNSLKYTYLLVKLASKHVREDSSIFWINVNNLHQL